MARSQLPGRFIPRNYTRLVQSFPSVAHCSLSALPSRLSVLSYGSRTWVGCTNPCCAERTNQVSAFFSAYRRIPRNNGDVYRSRAAAGAARLDLTHETSATRKDRSLLANDDVRSFVAEQSGYCLRNSLQTLLTSRASILSSSSDSVGRALRCSMVCERAAWVNSKEKLVLRRSLLTDTPEK